MLTHFGASQQQHTFELAVSLLSKQLCQLTWKLLFVLRYVATHCRLCQDQPSLCTHCSSSCQIAALPCSRSPVLHLASRLLASASKATRAYSIRANDALNPSAINNGDDWTPHACKVAPPPSTVSGNTPPSMNQLTAKKTTTLPPSSVSANLSSLMAQFLLRSLRYAASQQWS